ncbi:hypothetical protein FBU30_010487 [Linnemannia zychae]|nr:hypothetical protein FBU30_010487 [Linnemannia zychae]
MKEYVTFKDDEAKQYWESVQFKLDLKNTVQKAAASTAKASLYELEAEYSTYQKGSSDQPNEFAELSTSSESSDLML